MDYILHINKNGLYDIQKHPPANILIYNYLYNIFRSNQIICEKSGAFCKNSALCRPFLAMLSTQYNNQAVKCILQSESCRLSDI